MVDRKQDDATHDEFEPVDEDTGGEPELEDVEEYEGNKLKTLRDKLKQCEKEKMEHLEELQRTKAEYLNSRKRLEEQLERDTARARESFVGELLPLADSFDMAMQDPSWENCDEKWRNGIENIHAQLGRVLSSHGVSKIDATGVAFDPHEHEAVSNAPVDDEAKVDTVIDVVQAGYKMDDTIIRHAKVVVGIME